MIGLKYGDITSKDFKVEDGKNVMITTFKKVLTEADLKAMKQEAEAKKAAALTINTASIIADAEAEIVKIDAISK